MRQLLLPAVLSVTAALLTACPGPTPTPAPDPYADLPGTPPAPMTAAEKTVSISASLNPTRDSNGLLTLSIPGFVDSTGKPVKDLTDANFTVIEDGVLKGLASTAANKDTVVPTDIVFVFDTTGSMSGAITGVKESIVGFSNALQASGLDVRVGAVTFGDAFDTVAATSGIKGGVALGTPAAPPNFDTAERPTFPLSSDFAAFREFIGSNSARGGNDSPENGMGATEFAYDKMGWRPGASKVLIMITDVVQHQEGTGTIPAGTRWMPKTLAATLDKLRGKAVVHVIGPDVTSPGAYVDMKAFAGAAATGGIFMKLETALDLTKLPVSNVLSSSYTLKFRPKVTVGEHTIRVRVESGAIKGETTITATY